MRDVIVQTILDKCMSVKKGEQVLLVTDDPIYELGGYFYRTAILMGYSISHLNISPVKIHGDEPPPVCAAALKGSDVAILMTSKSLSHTKARKDACKLSGTRIASLPSINLDILNRAIVLDYPALKESVDRICALLDKGNTLEITTPAGTHLKMSIKGRKGFADHGLYSKRGAFGNLPAGEACIAPVEGTAEGVLVVDGSAPLVGKIDKPVAITVRKGYALDCPFPEIDGYIKKIGKQAYNIAELGIGVNPVAKITGVILEDEKVLGTAHMAIGNNKSFGGKVGCPCHLDFVFRAPEIFIDEKLIKV